MTHYDTVFNCCQLNPCGDIFSRHRNCIKRSRICVMVKTHQSAAFYTIGLLNGLNHMKQRHGKDYRTIILLT